MNTLETVLQDKLANLSSEECRQYGSVNETNKLIINKVMDYHNEPSLSSTDVNWEEFERDYDTRSVLQSAIYRL